MKGIWRAGSLAQDPEEQVEKDMETGIFFHRGTTGEPGRGPIYQGF